GGALPEAVPVVFDLDLVLISAHRHHHQPAVLGLRAGVDPIGEDAAGGVVLGAIEAPVFAVGGETGLGGPQRGGAVFGPAVTDQVAIGDSSGPERSLSARRLVQSVLDKGKMPAQSLRDIAVRRRQIDKKREQLRNAGAEATFFLGQAKPAATGFAQPGYRLIWKLPVVLALPGAFSDALEHRSE